MLSGSQLAAYRRDGFILLPDVLTLDEVEALGRVTDEFVKKTGRVAANDDVYDLAETHSAARPRVRRIKRPHLHHPKYARAARHPKIVEVPAAADAWPLLGFRDGIDKFDELLLLGEPTITPRLTSVPVRLLLPPAEYQGSIYENQRTTGRRFFATAAERRRAAVAAE